MKEKQEQQVVWALVQDPQHETKNGRTVKDRMAVVANFQAGTEFRFQTRIGPSLAAQLLATLNSAKATAELKKLLVALIERAPVKADAPIGRYKVIEI
jgi:hypothetical protein